ncbi:MAG: hypothetical protein ACK56I_13115, partial [bacterium]
MRQGVAGFGEDGGPGAWAEIVLAGDADGQGGINAIIHILPGCDLAITGVVKTNPEVIPYPWRVAGVGCEINGEVKELAIVLDEDPPTRHRQDSGSGPFSGREGAVDRGSYRCPATEDHSHGCLLK